MLELGQVVGEMRATEEPRSDIVVVDGPTVGDLGEIVVDVIGFGDDSVGGERLNVLAEPEGLDSSAANRRAHALAELIEQGAAAPDTPARRRPAFTVRIDASPTPAKTPA